MPSSVFELVSTRIYVFPRSLSPKQSWYYCHDDTASCSFPFLHCLCEVLEHLLVLLVPFEVLGFHEVLDPLLDHFDVGLEHAGQLLHDLHHQLLIKECLKGPEHGTNLGIYAELDI